MDEVGGAADDRARPRDISSYGVATEITGGTACVPVGDPKYLQVGLVLGQNLLSHFSQMFESSVISIDEHYVSIVIYLHSVYGFPKGALFWHKGDEKRMASLPQFYVAIRGD